MVNEIKKAEDNPAEILSWAERAKPAIKRSLPADMQTDAIATRFGRIFATMMRDEKYSKCSNESMMMCFMASAELGLEPTKSMGFCSFIPRGGSAEFELEYKGILVLMRRSGKILEINVKNVYQDDHFIQNFGDDERIEHTPGPNYGNDDLLTHTYLIVKMVDGGMHRAVMTRDQIEVARNCSKNKNGGPWTKHFGEMAKKTIIKREGKILPKSIVTPATHKWLSIEDENNSVTNATDVDFQVDQEAKDLQDLSGEPQEDAFADEIEGLES